MLLIPCPYCEEARPEIEFRYGGEAHIARANNPKSLSDAALADYLYVRSNPKGWHFERWQHQAGCGRFFNAVRHTQTDQMIATYKSGEPKRDLAHYLARARS